MTATMAPADLSWVTFSTDGDGSTCSFLNCSKQATHLGVYEIAIPCPHADPKDKPYCLAHKTVIVTRARLSSRWFMCPDCPRSKFRLLRIEPLR